MIEDTSTSRKYLFDATIECHFTARDVTVTCDNGKWHCTCSIFEETNTCFHAEHMQPALVRAWSLINRMHELKLRNHELK